MSTCEHDRIFSGEHFLSLPPQWIWICRTCREHGRLAQHAPPPIDLPGFVARAREIWPDEPFWQRAEPFKRR